MSENVSGRSSASRMWSITWPDRPERRHRHEVRLHETAGGLLGIFEVALERGAVAGRDLRQDLLLARLARGPPAHRRHRRSRARRRPWPARPWAAPAAAGRAPSRRARTALPDRSRVPAPRTSCTRCVGLQQLDEVGEVGRLQALRRASARASVEPAAERLRDRSCQFGGRSAGDRLVGGLCLHADRSASMSLRLEALRFDLTARERGSTSQGNRAGLRFGRCVETGIDLLQPLPQAHAFPPDSTGKSIVPCLLAAAHRPSKSGRDAQWAQPSTD